jgi:hypothetical protein
MIATFFTRISQIKDQLAVIADPIDDAELVTTMLNGFPPSWDPFVQGICARRRFPKFVKLWSDCTQEESRMISKTQNTNEEENQALAAKVKDADRTLCLDRDLCADLPVLRIVLILTSEPEWLLRFSTGISLEIGPQVFSAPRSL